MTKAVRSPEPKKNNGKLQVDSRLSPCGEAWPLIQERILRHPSRRYPDHGLAHLVHNIGVPFNQGQPV